MGITGLIPFLEKASKKCNISEFAGSTVVAVDTYCWLHKGAFSCAEKLARGEYTDAHIKYCMKYVNMLLSHSIKPILVFDGRHLPAKALTEVKRRESRKTAKKRAAELLRLGQIEEARSYIRRSVDITHEMALQLIKECREKNVDCIVAPYEADAQMAYLNKINVAQLVITEDSDLILFGCNKILFKMDLNGNGLLVESVKLPLVMKCPLEHYSFAKFRQMCIMSGCDYLASLPGIGLAKARQFINATRDPDISNALRKLPSYFKKSQLVVTDEYRDGFLKAEATFKHQLVYDPLQRKMVPLNDLEDEGTDPEVCSNAGALLDPETAFQLAVGNLDPFSLKSLDSWHPDHHKEKNAKTNSIWSKGYCKHQKQFKTPKTMKDHVTAITIPTTRALMTKIIQPKCDEEKELSIEELSTMYCVKQPMKKHITVAETQEFDTQDFNSAFICTKQPENIIVLETQEFDTQVLENHVSKNPFSINTCKRNVVSPDVSINQNSIAENSSKKRCLSPDKISSSPETSPILGNKNRNYKRFEEGRSLSKLAKLSKFQRTSLDPENFVQSKFFNSQGTHKQTPVKEESGLNVSGIDALNVNECDILNTPGENSILEDYNINDEPIRSDDSGYPVSLNDLSQSSKLTGYINPFMKNSCEKSNSEDSYNHTYQFDENLTPEPPQILNESIVGDIVLETQMDYDVKRFLSQPVKKAKSISQTTTSKSCRRPGLQRKNSAPAVSSQQSILTSFGFLKKSQLKH